MLKQIRGLYNTSKANNSVGIFGFQLTTRPAPMEAIPMIKYDHVPTGTESSSGTDKGDQSSSPR
jgi:hypothetical protein